MRAYLLRGLDAVSRSANAWWCGGHPLETLSVRAHREGSRESHRGWAAVELAIDRLVWWEFDHCWHAYWRHVRRMESALLEHARTSGEHFEI